MRKTSSFWLFISMGIFLLPIAAQADDTVSSTVEISTSSTSTVPTANDNKLDESISLLGQVLDTDGLPIFGTSLNLIGAGGFKSSATTDSDGKFIFSAPPGDYKVDVVVPPDRTDLIKPLPYFTSISEDEIRLLPITVYPATAIKKRVIGKVTLSDNKPVGDGEVSAYNRQTGQWVTTQTNTDGTYRLDLAIGTWQVDLRPNDENQSHWLWDGAAREVVFGANTTNDERKLNFSVKTTPHNLTVRLVDNQGLTVQSAAIIIEKVGQIFPKNEFKFQRADSTGEGQFWLTTGKYTVRASSLNPELVNPEIKTITITNPKNSKVELIFKNRELARSNLSGRLTLSSGAVAQSTTVVGWSDQWGEKIAQTDSSGFYSFKSLPRGIWKIHAEANNQGVFEKNDIQINLTSENYLANLNLFAAEPKLNTELVSNSPTEPLLVSDDSGATIYFPPLAMASSSVTGTIKITINDEPKVVSKSNNRVVGSAYDIKVQRDAGGDIVNSFDKKIEITLPYTDSDLKKLNIKSSDLAPGYYDENSGVWAKIKDYVINPDKKVATLRTSHLSVFALLAPPDLIPPSPITKISAVVREIGTVNLYWTNPSADFDHVKIYRSEKKSSLGATLSDNVFQNNITDADLGKKTYYYTVVAVDGSGNESKKATISINAGKVNVPTKIPSGLRQGSTGEAVRLLQKALIKSGDLPSDYEISGNFDKQTLDAMRSFQKNNKLSLTTSTGPKTVATLNKLLK